MTAESNAQDARKAAERMAKQAAQTASHTASRAKAASAHSHDAAADAAASKKADDAAAVAKKNESHERPSAAQLRQSAKEARADLASTLDAIEFKFNVPKQLRLKTKHANDALKRLGEDSPQALAGIALGAATIVGTAVWLGARAFIQRR